jgi:hypothetical protein
MGAQNWPADKIADNIATVNSIYVKGFSFNAWTVTVWGDEISPAMIPQYFWE